jgi:hypothetical protein
VPISIESREWSFTDKEGWGPGPWQEEPDKLQWIDATTGLPCIILRGPVGSLCGYVGVEVDHPWHGKGYSDKIPVTKEHLEREFDLNKLSPIALVRAAGSDFEKDGISIDLVVSVHGGITYANYGYLGDKDREQHIGTIPLLDKTWWFGFDCSHCDDFAPPYRGIGSLSHGAYRDLEYVRDEVTALATQLAAAS